MTTTGDIRTAVYEALVADPRIATDDIEVDLQLGSVLLKGTVPTQEQHSEATEVAQRVPDVGTVYNLLDVAMPSVDYGDDDALARLVNQALAANAAVPDSIKATVSEGYVRLSGIASQDAQRSEAQQTAAGVAGILGLDNEVVVFGGQ
jgi:osmotically-inducible protein OsmY